MTPSDWTLPALALAAAGIVTLGIAWMKSQGSQTRVRRAPPLLMLPDHPEADWRLAPVHISALVIRYRKAEGDLAEWIVHPKTIRGECVGNGRVRPTVVNAFCETEQGMRALRLERIVSAADLRTGDFIDDLYTYFGGAQPGGAPARIYQTATPDRLIVDSTSP